MKAKVPRGAGWIRGARSGGRSRWTLASIAASALVGGGVSGCANIPGTSTAWAVDSVAQRGPYLDVSVSRGGSTQRFFTPASEPCRSLLRAEASVDYVSLGPLGQFQAGDAKCDPVGIGSLARWRDQRPRPAVGPLPARQASYRLDYQDADLAMLRGRFPLLGLIGWPGMGDTLVLLPKTEPCQALLQQDVATIEYRVAGPDPYVLYDGETRCAILGLIQPIGQG
jgi:hypothetical protein